MKERKMISDVPELLEFWCYERNELSPDKLSVSSRQRVWWRCERGHYHEMPIKNKVVGKPCPYCAGRYASFDNNLTLDYPKLAKEWHPTKNGDLTPEQVLSGSHKKVWWQCEHGHEWEVEVRLRKKFGCPYCSGRRAIIGKTDFATTHPELIKEWHPTKNLPLTPDQITYGSNQDVWWQCERGHEWKSKARTRVSRGDGCPYCANKKVWKGFNDLATTHPHLAKEWHPTRNGELSSHDVVFGSTKEVWWQCEKGYEWKAKIHLRTKGHKNCSCCQSENTPPKGTTFGEWRPELVKEWHPTKNSQLSLYQLTPFSNRKVWWQCEKGHEWEAAINHRSRGNGKCPTCSGRGTVSDFYPHLIQEWHPTKNGELTPYNVSRCSGKKVWWKCQKGHEWEALVSHRANNTNCPYCSKRYATLGETDLETTHPQLVKEWHPHKNMPITPQQITAGVSKKFWWQCQHGHEWKATVSNRTLHGYGCPYCSNQKVTSGVSDLETLFPELAKEWHPTKNGDLFPSQVTPFGHSRKVWWKCSLYGHEWQSTVGNRSQGKGCPFCNNSRGEKEIISKLNKHNIPFKTQVSFEDCRHQKPLPFDIAILKRNEIVGLIEFDGEQHFEAIEVFGGEKALKETQLRDQIKTTYCQQNNIPLLRIPHWDFNKIEELLLTFIKQLDTKI